MKKTIGLIVLLIALSVCVVSLAACDPGSGNQATPQSIQFEDKDGADRSTYWDLGTFPYGTAYEDILPTFKVNLCYSDGSTKELAAGDYTVSYKFDIWETPLAAIPAVPKGGFYQIVFEKDNFQARIVFIIDKTARPGCELILKRNAWSYNETPPKMSVTNYTATEDAAPLYYAVPKEVYDALTDVQKVEYWNHLNDSAIMLGDYAKGLSAGQYYAFAVVPGDDVAYTETHTPISDDVLFTVNRTAISKPSPKVADSVVLDDGSIVVYSNDENAAFDVILENLRYDDPETEISNITYVVSISAENSGVPLELGVDYNFGYSHHSEYYTFSLFGHGDFTVTIAPNTNGYCWDDGTTDPVSCSFKVIKP